MRLRVYILLFILPIFGYGQVTLLSETDTKEYQVREPFNLSIGLEIIGDNYQQQSPVRLPDLSKFEILGNATESVAAIDPETGNVVRQVLYHLILQPKHAGKTRIGSALVQVNGKTYKSEPFEILVRDGKRKNDTWGRSVSMIMEVLDKDVYQNQPVNVVLKLKANPHNYQDFRKVNHIKLPQNTKKIHTVNLKREDIEIDKSDEMAMQVIASFVVVPEKEGNFIISPATALFNEERILSNPLRIHVKKLPEGAPSSFKNAVGKFDLKVEIPEEATSGEVILSSNETSKSIGRLTVLPKPSVLYAYVAYNKIVKLDLQTGKELETIAEIGREYLGRGIYYLKSTNEIIGIQSRNSEYDLFKLNLTTKEIIKLPCNHYEKLIIANNELYAYDLNNRKIVKLDLQTGKEIETIAEVGRNYLNHIQFLPKTNEIIGLQSEYNSETSENVYTFFRLNLVTKEIVIKSCDRYEDFIVANDDLYAYVSYNKIVKLNIQTGEELETIAEIGRDYLAHIQFSKSTNEIIGLQSGTEKNLFKLNLKTKQISKTPIKNYENLIIANY